MRTPIVIARSFQEMLSTNWGTGRGWVRAMLANVEDAVGRIECFESFSAQATERLVFVCWGNICRSAFADRLARSMQLNAVSVGLETNTGIPAFVLTREAAALRGLDMASHRTTAWPDFEPNGGDLYLTMEIRQAQRLLRLGVPTGQIALLGRWSRPRRLHLHDPHTLSAAYFQTCFALIDSAVRNLAIELAQAGSPAARAVRASSTEASIVDSV